MPARVRTLVRSTLARAACVLVALAVLLAVVRGGTRFFYCHATHLSFDAPPCASDDAVDDADDADGPLVRAADCCQEKWRSAPPTASTPKLEPLSVAPAALAPSMHGPTLDDAVASSGVP